MKSLGLILVSVLAVGPYSAASGSDHTGDTGYERNRRLAWLDNKTEGRVERGMTNDRTSISADGRWVAFVTDRALVSDDKNELPDVYVRDMRRGTVELVSRSSTGVPAVGKSTAPSITNNGRFIAFQSTASNLVVPDTNVATDIFVFDRKKGITERVSVNNEGQETRSPLGSFPHSFQPSISANGRFVSFISEAMNLVPDDTNGVVDIFVRDRVRGSTMRASVASDGSEGQPEVGQTAGQSGFCHSSSSISGNGRFVAFDSLAANLVEDDSNRGSDVFVHDLRSRKTERVSVASDGAQAHVPPGHVNLIGGSCLQTRDAISNDGRFVVFSSISHDLVPNDADFVGAPSHGDDGMNVFVNDRRTGRTERVSVEPHGGEVKPHLPGWVYFKFPSISPEGRYVTFRGRLGGKPSYYRLGGAPWVYDRVTGAVDAIEVESDPIEPDLNWWDGHEASISRGGRYLAISSGFNTPPGGPACPGSVPCPAIIWADRGDPLGAHPDGSMSTDEPSPPDDRICVEGTCVPPGKVISASEGSADGVPAGRGADLVRAVMAVRPEHDDLYIRIEVDRLPGPRGGVGGVAAAGDPTVVYGARFSVEGTAYEVRAARTGVLSRPGEPTFRLFRCAPRCSEVARLAGGYGTAGESIVTGVPLRHLRTAGRSLRITASSAYSALGTDVSGAIRILDRVDLRARGSTGTASSSAAISLLEQSRRRQLGKR